MKHYQEHIKHLRTEYDKILGERSISKLWVHSGGQHQRFLDDTYYPYKVNPHFNYWVPLTKNPQCFLLVEPHKRPTLYFYAPVDFWHKHQDLPSDEWTKEFDVKILRKVEEASALINPSDVLITEFPNEFPKHENFNPKELIDDIHFLRTLKTPYEQDCLRKANALAINAHARAKESFFAGKSEFEIHLDYLNAVQGGETEVPYDNIIALNENAGILHYTDYQKKAPAPHSFLIDAGAKINGYAADITRTYSYERNEFNDLIFRLDEEQQKLGSQVEIGVSYVDNHKKSHHVIAKLLKEFEFVRLDEDAMVEKEITKKFYPHGLGHFLGIQVHDVGGYKNREESKKSVLRCAQNIRPGHVFTVEPGLYFIPTLLKDLKESPEGIHVNWSKVESFLKYGGIRIEDNILMTESGPQNLTRN